MFQLQGGREKDREDTHVEVHLEGSTWCTLKGGKVLQVPNPRQNRVYFVRNTYLEVLAYLFVLFKGFSNDYQVWIMVMGVMEAAEEPDREMFVVMLLLLLLCERRTEGFSSPFKPGTVQSSRRPQRKELVDKGRY